MTPCDPVVFGKCPVGSRPLGLSELPQTRGLAPALGRGVRSGVKARGKSEIRCRKAEAFVPEFARLVA